MVGNKKEKRIHEKWKWRKSKEGNRILLQWDRDQLIEWRKKKEGKGKKISVIW